MPNVHFIGDIEFASISASDVSVTWAIVPGNTAWYLKRGISYGETHICVTSEQTGKAIISHPIDCHYDCSSTEGWPMFICEVWDRSYGDFRGLHSCGSVWLPSCPGNHALNIHLWKPCSDGLEHLHEYLLPSIPDLRALRELTVSPYLRSQMKVENVGNLQLNVSTMVCGFEACGVQFTCPSS